MQLNPAEISELLKAKIENLDTKPGKNVYKTTLWRKSPSLN